MQITLKRVILKFVGQIIKKNNLTGCGLICTDLHPFKFAQKCLCTGFNGFYENLCIYALMISMKIVLICLVLQAFGIALIVQ